MGHGGHGACRKGDAIMADIINFQQARKARARAQEHVQAASNRVLFGRTKEEKRLEKAQSVRQEKLLDGAKRDGD
jgi:hypothetical protein